MMKIIVTAMGNAVLNNELNRYEEYEVNETDLFYQDAVIDYLTSNNPDVLIVSALLQGQIEFGEFIEKVRTINKNIRIIVVTDTLSENMKRTLAEYDVVDIFLDSEVQMLDILDAINREEPIRKKIEMVKERPGPKYITNTKNEIYKEVAKNVQKQEVIVINGTNGSR